MAVFYTQLMVMVNIDIKTLVGDLLTLQYSTISCRVIVPLTKLPTGRL